MHNIRKLINIVEQSDLTVYHGGTYSGGPYNADMRGEPGNLRPLGKGLYAAETPEHAARYLKYATDSSIKTFKVSPEAKLYPWGGAAWNSVSSVDQEWWRAKSAEVQRAFEKNGLVRKSSFRDEYGRWNDAISTRPTDSMRQLLVSLGVDGSVQHIGDGMIEYVFYNTDVLKLVK